MKNMISLFAIIFIGCITATTLFFVEKILPEKFFKEDKKVVKKEKMALALQKLGELRNILNKNAAKKKTISLACQEIAELQKLLESF